MDLHRPEALGQLPLWKGSIDLEVTQDYRHLSPTFATNLLSSIPSPASQSHDQKMASRPSTSYPQY